MKRDIKALLWIVLKTVLLIGFFILVYSSCIYILNNITDALSKNILEYLKVAIWPIVILAIVILFKKNISHLLERMDEWDVPFIGKGKAHSGLAQQQDAPEPDINMPQAEGVDFQAIVELKEQEIKSLQDNTEQLVDKLTRAQIELDFERIYNPIFASQIDLLSKLGIYPQVEFGYVVDHYSKVQQSFEVFKEWNVNQYIQFLILHQLIEYKIDCNTISITQKGKAFLAYLAVMNYKKYGI